MKFHGALIVGALLVLGVAAYAHHPFGAEYDWMKPVTVTGTVTKLELTNPHSHLYVDAKDSQGQMKHWSMELGSASALSGAGWTRTTVKSGDMVTVDAWLARDGSDRANVKSVKLSDGRKLSGRSSILEEGSKPTSN